MENPFKGGGGAAKAKAEPGKTLMGRPASSFSEPERSLIDDQLGRFCDILAKEPGSKIFVDELILTDIEIRRGDSAAADFVEGDDDKKLKAWEKRRDALMDRHISALKALGAMPGDKMNDEVEALADVYVRYAAEVSARVKRATPIGQMSVNAVGLAQDKGLHPETYTAAVMAPADRAELLAEVEKASGH